MRIPTADYRWNFGALMTEIIFFGIAFTFINPSSVLPAFARKLTERPVLIGLAGAIYTAGWTLPQLLSANVFGRDPRSKPYMRLGVVARLLLWLIPLALWLGLGQRPAPMLALFFLCLTAFAVLDGLTAVPWGDFLAREIPANRRGRLQGAGQLVGGLANVGAGALMTLILGRLDFPRSYALLFTLGVAAFMPGTVALLLLREHVPQEATARPEAMSAGGWFRPLLDDVAFRRLALCHVLHGLTTLASAFYVGHATDVLLLPERAVGQFTIALTVAGIASGLLFGLLSDLSGPRLVIRLGILLAALTPALALLAHHLGMPWAGRLYPLVFVGLGFSGATFVMGFSNYVMEMAPEAVRPAYIGLGNTLAGLSSIWPLLGGWLLTATASYPLLFGLTAALVALAFVSSLWLPPASTRRPPAVSVAGTDG